MKKKVKTILLFYVGVAVVTYAVSLRFERLSNMEDQKYQNKQVVLKVK